MKRLLQTTARGVGLLAVLTIVGCPFSPDKGGGDGPPVEPDFKERVTPQNLLYNLKQTYKLRNVAEYDSLLAMDFTFVLSAEDAAKPDMPDQWGRDPEIQIHQRMFDAEMVQTLTLDFVVGDLAWDPAENMYAIIIRDVDLYLYGSPYGSTPSHPADRREYWVRGSRSRFWFRKNGWVWPGTRDSVWTIVKWEDNPVAGSRPAWGPRAGEELTWGVIKALFRQPGYPSTSGAGLTGPLH